MKRFCEIVSIIRDLVLIAALCWLLGTGVGVLVR